jgi:hypothetical protein
MDGDGVVAGESVTFQEAIEIIESFPEEQRGALLDVTRCRLMEDRREWLARDVKRAKAELKRGEVRRGTVEDPMRELLRTPPGVAKNRL